MKILANVIGALVVSVVLPSHLCYAQESGSADVGKKQLYFSLITSITAPQGGFKAAGALPMVDWALEQININSEVLTNYSLDYTTIRDSQCTRTAALDAFFEDFDNASQPTYISTMCCGCSVATVPVAEISHYWNVPHLIGASSTQELKDRERFKSIFRVLPTFVHVAPGIGVIMKQFGWKQMAVITQQESIFTLVTEGLQQVFDEESLKLDQTSNIISGTDPLPFDELLNWDEEYRIIFINTYSNLAIAILCEAHKRSMFGPEYVWITLAWYNENWWKAGSSPCTTDMLKEVLVNSLGIVPNGFFPVEDPQAMTISGITPKEFEAEYVRRLNLPEYSDYDPVFAPGVGYDLAWAMAIGLNITAEKIMSKNVMGCENEYGELLPLEKFEYSNDKMGCVMIKSFSEVNFTGITGQIMFDNDGDRLENTLNLQQYRNNPGDSSIIRLTVAEVLVDGDKSAVTFSSGESSMTLWEDGPPYDGSAVDVVHSTNLVLQVFYSIFSLLGLIYCIFCVGFNIWFRKKRLIKLTSPNLNHLLIFGAAMLYSSVFLYIFTATDPEAGGLQELLCYVRQWMFSLGYTLCFAIILAKTWRVYYIFNNPTHKKMIIKDWVLFVIVGVITGIDAIILLIGSSVPQISLNSTLNRDQQHLTDVDDNGIIIHNFVFVCTTTNVSIIWLTILFAYKGLLQIVAIFMAFHTRKVSIKALNESLETAALIYINSIILVVLTVTEFVLYNYHDVYSAVFGLALLIGATLFLSLIFIPKMVNLYRDPREKQLFTSNSDMTTSVVINRSDLGTTKENSNASLKSKIAELEEKLAKFESATKTT